MYFWDYYARNTKKYTMYFKEFEKSVGVIYANTPFGQFRHTLIFMGHYANVIFMELGFSQKALAERSIRAVVFTNMSIIFKEAFLGKTGTGLSLEIWG